MPQMKGLYTTCSSWHIDHSTFNTQHSTFNNLLLFQKLFLEISCGFENKVVTLRHGFLIQMIMKQVEERYISFEASKMAYRDIKNFVDTAKREGIAEGKEIGMKEGMEKGMEKGREEGRAEGMNLRSLEIARKMLAKGMDEASIMDMTGLTVEEIKLLKAEM